MSHLLLTDYGGVLGRHHLEPAESTLAAMLHVSVPVSRQLLSERSPEGKEFREDEISEVEFWTRVIARTPVEQALDEQLVARLSDLWAETYSLDLLVLPIFQRARSKAKVGVLTNIDRARSRYLEEVVGINDLVDIYLPSYRFRATKPSEDLWRRADDYLRERLGAEIIVTYVDDRQVHVDSCAVVGWQGLLFEGAAKLEMQLASLGLAELTL